MSDIDAIRRRAEQAEADNAAWEQIVSDLDLLGCLDCSNAACDRARDALSTPHPGVALLAELEAARALAAQARALERWYFDRDPDAEPIDADDLMYRKRFQEI